MLSFRQLASHWIYPAAAALVLLAATATMVTAVTTEIAGFRSEVQRAQAVKRELATLSTSLNGAERDLRAAVTGGDAAALARFRANQQAAQVSIDALRADVKSDAARAPVAGRLHDFVNARLKTLGDVARAQERGETTKAADILRDLPRLALITTAVLEDPGIDAGREQDATRAMRMVAGMFALLFTAAVALLFLAYAFARRGYAVSAMYEALQREAKARLEQDQVLHETRASLAQAQKMEAMGQLTGTIAHDFNNVLAAIIGALNLTRRRLARGEATAGEMIDAAMDAAERGATLTQRLLSFSRRRPTAVETLRADAALARVRALAERTAGPDIALDMPQTASADYISVDTAQFETAVINLVINARDAMPKGGTLKVRTERVALTAGAGRNQGDLDPGDYILLTVTDTGSGMSPDVAARAFDPFFTTKSHGTGLGLSQVYGLAKQSKGHVEISSRPGAGTTVTLYLPVVAPPAAAPREAAFLTADLPQARAGETILVVDDEQMVRAVSAGILRELGYKVLEAGGGAEALAILEGAAADLLFTDIVMPGMNGVELAARVVADHPAIKVLYATGYPRDALDRANAAELRGQLLLKPFSLENLAHAVRRLLDGDAPPDAPTQGEVGLQAIMDGESPRATRAEDAGARTP